MIKVKTLINLLKKNNSDFFTGVPDSVLKELSISLQSKNKKNHKYRPMKVPQFQLELAIISQQKNCQLFICRIQDYQMH